MPCRLTFRLFALAGSVLCCGCDWGEPPLVPPGIDAAAATTQAIDQYDADQDGIITGPELDKCPGLKAGLPVIDKDGDNRLTAAEIEGRFREYQEEKTALFSVVGRATLNGRPLAGAVITLVPEKFMGPTVKPAKGTTDESGFCMFQIEGEQFGGSHYGIFRIEVSKPNAAGKETIPARYNVDTTLGADVGVQSPSLYDLGLKLTSP